MRTSLALSWIAPVIAIACVEPTNPCDPNAPAEVQAQGTRIAGRVVDQDGVGVLGVTVSVGGLALTTTTGEDGAFALTNVPPRAEGYSLTATPQAPLVGGSARVERLACQEQKDGIEIAVVRPRDAPEVELVRAGTATSLLVAFGAGADADEPAAPEDFYVDGGDFRGPEVVAADCRSRADAAPHAWRVQVRPPFDGWHDAVLGSFPWLSGETAVVGAGAPGAILDGAILLQERTENVCAAALCAQFSYLEPSLADPRARCANVVGYVDGDVVVPLEAFGSYEVRVLSEVRVDPALVQRFALPERVRSTPPTGIGQMSLVPSALLPLVDETGAPLSGRDLDVRNVVATGGGRFALVEGDGVRVLGTGDDVFAANGADAALAGGAPQGALAADAATADAAAADFLDDGDTSARALAALPAGDWVRVVKEGDAGARIEKVYIGANALAGREGADIAERNLAAAAEARLPIAPSATPLGAMRAVSYLDPGASRSTDIAAHPRDAYLLLYARGFVLVENGVESNLMLAHFAATSDGRGSFATAWDDPADLPGDPQITPSSAFAGDCAAVRPIDDGDIDGAFGVVDAGADVLGIPRTEVAVCYDFQSARGEAVDFRDVDVLVADEPMHVIADAALDRVVVAPLSALTGARGPLAENVSAIPVGRTPVALTRSRIVSCGGSGADTEVLLVANAGSGDISALALTAAGIEEIAVVALPGTPVGFIDDAEGPRCDDPFAWVIAADGELFPIDMRGAPSVPLCDGGACAIGSRGRARTGAIGRIADRAGRAVVGGQGLVGELGFFRPAALPGDGAYAFDVDLVTSGP